MRRKRSRRVPITLFSFQDIITSVTAILLLLTLLLAFELVQQATVARATQPRRVAERVTESLQEVDSQLRQLQAQLASQGTMAAELAKTNKVEIQQQAASADTEIVRLTSEIRQLTKLKEKFSEEHAVRRTEQRGREKDRKRLADIREEQQRVQQEIEELRNSNRRFFRVPPVSGKNPWLVEIAGSHILVAQFGSKQASRQFEQHLLTSAGSAFLQWANAMSPSSDYFVLAIRPSGVRVFSDVFQGLRRRGFDVGFEILGANDVLLDEGPVTES